ncbi:hypothetical protein CANCADRAFT_42511 [Tortispora caseinolytica NRRL Y-17796]|uniref:Uncharacterized protein n=1 Tax=Tortispora caseinolytica NRRL Y-17796 TaxID=767744 RepID=A0A1E4TJH1_9ASCO|nr:hypothetical protein CANCADRAFT_42511 [Tortispora caseinolytica NRRL Y-17796]
MHEINAAIEDNDYDIEDIKGDIDEINGLLNPMKVVHIEKQTADIRRQLDELKLQDNKSVEINISSALFDPKVIESLDAKISELENKIGVLNDTELPILSITHDLEKKLDLLNIPDTEWALKAQEVKKFITLMNSVDEDRPSFDHQINELYKCLPSLKSMSALLPVIVDRLQSIQLLQTEALNSMNLVTAIDTRTSAILDDVAQWQQQFNDLKALLDKNIAISKDNLDQVNNWIKELT